MTEGWYMNTIDRTTDLFCFHPLFFLSSLLLFFLSFFLRIGLSRKMYRISDGEDERGVKK